METNKKALISGALFLAILIVGFGAWHYYESGSVNARTVSIVPLNGQNGTQAADGSNVVSIGGRASLKAPLLERPIPATSPNIDPSARPAAIKYLNTSVANLKKNPNSLQDWINLGLAREVLADYVGAEEAWTFATKLSPSNELAYASLGNLYMSYLKDGVKAEANFKVALSIAPSDVGIYRSLAELYTYHYKQDTNAAEQILKEGFAKNPLAYDLGVLLARYYRDHGMIAEAKAAYTAAADSATKGGSLDIAKSITAERDQLK